MKKNKLPNIKKIRKLLFLLALIVMVGGFYSEARAGMPLYPQGVIYYSNNGALTMGDSTTPNSFAQGIAYRSNVSGQSMWDPRVSFNVADPSAPMPAWYGWDVGSSAWTTSPQVGDNAMTVFETRNGLLGWTGANWVGGVKRVLTQNDITTNTINNNAVVMELIPTPQLDAANTSNTKIGLTWTGLWDNDTAASGGNANNSIVSYSIYRSVNGGAFQAHGSPYAIVSQNAGGAVKYSDSSVSIGNTYSYKLTVNFEWNNHTPAYYETIGEGPESGALAPIPPDPSKIGFLSGVQTISAGSNSNVITIETRDSSGNTAAVKSDTTIDLSSNSTSANKKFYAVSGGACTSTQITQVSVLTGSSTAQFCYYDEIKSNPTWTITAHKSSPATPLWTDGTQAITVNASATIASIRIDNASNGTGSEIANYTMTADQTLTLWASGFDPFGNFSANVNVTWASSGIVPALSGTGTSKIFAPTTAPASGTITIDDGAGHTDSTGIITINPGVAASFDVVAPANATAGNAFAITSITAKDADGNVASGYSGTKTLTFSGPGAGPETGSPAYTSSVNFTSGVATTTLSTTLVKAETTKITASQAGISGQSGSVIVAAASAAHLHVTAPGTATAGTQFNLTSIYAHDFYGNLATTYSGSKTINYIGPSAGPLGNAPTYTTSVDFSNGSSTTTLATTLFNRETVAITANDGSLSGTSSNIAVGAGTSGSIEYVSGNNQTGTVNQVLPQPLVVRVKDIYGNLKNGQIVAWTVTGGDGSFSPATSTSASDGTAQGSWKIGSLASNNYNYAEASVSGLSGSPIEFAATGASGSASVFEVDAPTNATAGTSFAITIKALDSFGNVVSGFTGTKTVSYSGPGNGPKTGVPTYQTSVDFTNGVAANVPVTLVKAETSTLTIKSGSYSGESLPITVSAGPTSNYEVVAPSTATVGQQFNLVSIKAIDAFGNYTTDISGTKTFVYSGPGNSPSGTAPTYTTSVDLNLGVALTTLATTLVKAQTTSITINDGTYSGTSNPIVVTYQDTLNLVYVSGDNQSAMPSTELPNSLVVYVANKDGSPAIGKVVHFSPSSGTPSATDVTTGSDGLASINWTLGSSIGLQIMTASSAGISTTVVFSADAGSVMSPKIAITSIAQDVKIDSASAPITACLEDSSGNNRIVSVDTPLNLSSTDPSGTFSLSSNGPWNATSIDVLAGQSCATFYYEDSTEGVKILTASSAGFTSATQPIFISNGVSNKPQLVFTTAAQTIAPGISSDVITVCVQDGNGNNQNVTSDTLVNLATSSTTGAFALTSSGTWNLQNVTIPAGKACSSFYYHDSATGMKTISLSSNNIQSASQSIFVPESGSTTTSGTINNYETTDKIDKSINNTTNNTNNYYTIEVNNYYYYGNSSQQSTTKIDVKNSPFPVITSPRDGSLIYLSGGGVFVSGTAKPNESIAVYSGNQILGSATSDNHGLWELYVGIDKFKQSTASIVAKSFTSGISSAPVTFSLKKNSSQDDLLTRIKNLLPQFLTAKK